MNKFEIGKEYFTHSICDSGCMFTIKITGRTEKTVSYIYDGDERRSKIRVDESGEYIQPDRYSMAPIFRAKREVQSEEPAETVAAPKERAEEPAASNVVILSQQTDNAVVVILGQRIERNCGACFPVASGTVIGFVDVPDGRFSRGGIYAVIRWDDTPDTTERVKLADIHPHGWRSANGSPLGVFVV